MTEDSKQDLVLEATTLAARTIADHLRRHAEILQEERAAGVMTKSSQLVALKWVHAALELWREFMGR